MSFYSHPSASPIRSRKATHQLIILSTLAPNHFLPGDGTPVCSGHGTVFFCEESPSKLKGGLEEWQSHMDSGPSGQMRAIKAASPSHGGDKRSISEPLSKFTAPPCPTGISGSSRKITPQTPGWGSFTQLCFLLSPMERKGLWSSSANSETPVSSCVTRNRSLRATWMLSLF